MPVDALPNFTIVLRGYDPAQVDAVVRRAAEARVSTDPAQRSAVLSELSNTRLLVKFRGYDRSQVDDYLRQVTNLLR
ncbi:hypothetical protein GCM10027280_19960 [Micromonospora polyrhachis]|uniref:DivIVA domain-containing protein n=1 Tax=Micromonospora polyrhachis TaxID=1282883 RepID=A0A7W7WRZ8_9ACTN|nr:DivIVA domain-containing protein [Micromonospora polyrhachis]MBB4961786.1 DivIVA domain-containing protein [Micromonospora polyrhachis]